MYRKNIELAFTQVADYTTCTKKRVCSGSAQYIRIDNEKNPVFSIPELKEYQELISEQIQKKPDIIIVSDYLKGAINKEIYDQIVRSFQI